MGEFREVVTVEDVVCTRATDKAILVVVPGMGDIWIPQWAVDDRSEVYQKGDEGTLWVKESLAREKGLA